MKYGFIGTGAMGNPMSQNLLKAGYELVITNSEVSKMDSLVAMGAEAVKTATEVAQKAEKVFLCLPNAEIVREVISEMLSAERRVTTGIYDMSTVGPNDAKEFSAMCKEIGVDFCDCPVAGGTSGAAAGTLSIMIGGDEEVVKVVEGPLNTMGKNITLAGPVGSGAAVKMFNNYLGGSEIVATCEVLIMAKLLGMNLDKLIEIINKSTGRNFATEMAFPGFLKNRDFTPGFTVDLFYKDICIAMKTANELKMPITIGPATLQAMGATRAMGLGKEHSLAIIKYYEELAGVKVN